MRLMETRDKIYMGIMVMFFYVGDLTSTYLGLQAGGHEGNPILASFGFAGTIVMKTIFMIMAYFMLNYITNNATHSDWDKYHLNPFELKGIFVGSVLMVGLLAILINTGIYS